MGMGFDFCRCQRCATCWLMMLNLPMDSTLWAFRREASSCELTHTYTHVQIYAYTHTRTHLWTHTHACTHTCTHAHTHTMTIICTCICRRALVQRCDKVKVHNLVSVGGQHQGVFGFPRCPGNDSTICETVRRLLNIGAYVSFVQDL